MFEKLLWAFLSSFFLVFFIFPYVIKFLSSFKIGQMIQDDGPSHQSKENTPTMGGFFLVIVWHVLAPFFIDVTNIYFCVLEIVLLGNMLIGFIDDRSKILYKDNNLGLSAKSKFLLQFLVATVAVSVWLYLIPLVLVNNIKITLFGLISPVYINFSYVYPLFAIFTIVGSSNAVNLTDGLDGLVSVLLVFVCFGLSYIIAFDFVPVSLLDNVYYGLYIKDLAILLAIIMGSCLGFLWFNAYPAQIFLGDTGSLCLGGVISIVALMIKAEFVFFIMSFVFVIETVSVFMQVLYYKMYKKRIFKMAPLHHHYELSGITEPKIVVRMWVVGLLFLVIALLNVY